MSQQTLLNHLTKTLNRTQERVAELEAMIAAVKQIPVDTKTLDMLAPLQEAKKAK